MSCHYMFLHFFRLPLSIDIYLFKTSHFQRNIEVYFMIHVSYLKNTVFINFLPQMTEYQGFKMSLYQLGRCTEC